jgi:hypothetical protein
VSFYDVLRRFSRGGRENSASIEREMVPGGAIPSIPLSFGLATILPSKPSQCEGLEAFRTFVNSLPPEPEPFDFSQDPPEVIHEDIRKGPGGIVYGQDYNGI